MMNIALATDDRFARPCAVCVASILENNKDEELHIYILTCGLLPANVALFTKLSDIYQQTIEVKVVDTTTIKEIKANERFPIANYYRLLLPGLLDVDRVLYLDCDIIVRKSLMDFYYTDLDGYACAVVEDHEDDYICLQNRNGVYGKFCNAGVLVMNLKFWRENDVVNRLVDFIVSNYGKILYPDQDALNYEMRGKLKFCEYTYNFQVGWYGPIEDVRMHKDKWGDILKYKDDPAVVHYNCTEKPWMNFCPHPHTEWFFEYADKYDFLRMKNPNVGGFTIQYRIIQRLLSSLMELSKKVKVRR